MLTWTRRMTKVDEIDAAALAEHGKRPTLRAVGLKLGLTGQSIYRYRWKIARWKSFERQHDDHVRLWRTLMLDAVKALRLAIRNRKIERNAVTWVARAKRQATWWRREPYWPYASREELKAAQERHQQAVNLALASEAARRKSIKARRAASLAEIAADPVLAELDRLTRQRVRKGD